MIIVANEYYSYGVLLKSYSLVISYGLFSV